MLGTLKNMRIHAVASSLLYALLGLIFMLLPGVTERLISYLLAVALLLAGIVFIVDYFRAWQVKYQSSGLAIGVLAIFAALYLFLKAGDVRLALSTLLGFAVIVSGAGKLQNAVVLKRFEDKGWGLPLVFSIGSLIYGIMLIENPFSDAHVWIVAMGAGLFFSGITDLIAAFMVARRLSKGAPAAKPEQAPAPQPEAEEVKKDGAP